MGPSPPGDWLRSLAARISNNSRNRLPTRSLLIWILSSSVSSSPPTMLRTVPAAASPARRITPPCVAPAHSHPLPRDSRDWLRSRILSPLVPPPPFPVSQPWRPLPPSFCPSHPCSPCHPWSNRTRPAPPSRALPHPVPAGSRD